MNVAFHELAAIALTQETGARLAAAPANPARTRLAWAVTMLLAVGSHGVLDALPHYYPLPSAVDAAVSIALVGAALVLLPRALRWPLVLVGLAALLPDIIDHLPDDLKRHAGLPIPPLPNVFPWHWRSGSGSWPGRTGPLWIESLVNHTIVLSFCAASIVRNRHLLRWPRAQRP